MGSVSPLPPKCLPSLNLGKKVGYLKQLCLAKVAKARLEDARLIKSLEFWHVLHHSDSQNEDDKSSIRNIQTQLQTQLQTLMDRKEDGRRIRSRTKWMNPKNDE